MNEAKSCLKIFVQQMGKMILYLLNPLNIEDIVADAS